MINTLHYSIIRNELSQYIPGINGELLIATELNLRGEKKQQSMIKGKSYSYVAKIELKKMLGLALGCSPKSIVLVKNLDGKEFLHKSHGVKPNQLDFSVSYGPKGFAICLIEKFRIGVDLQRFNHRQYQNFVYLFDIEPGTLQNTLMEVQKLWTRMEAYGKMCGKGLDFGLQRLFQIASNPHQAPIPCQFIDCLLDTHTSLCLCISED